MATQKQLSPANLAFSLGSEIPSLDNMARVSQPFAMSGSGNIAFNMRAGTGTTGEEFIARIADFYNSSVSKEAEQRARNAFGAGMISPEHPDADVFVGRAICSRSGCVGNPALFLRRNAKAMGLQMPESLPDEAGCYSFIGKHIRGQAAKAYDEQQAYIRKVQQAQDQLAEMNADQWAALINGDEIRNKKFLATIGNLPQDQQGEWVNALGKARAAINIIQNFQREGGMKDYGGLDGKTFANLPENMTEEQWRQLSRAETRRSLYELTANRYAALYDALSAEPPDGSRKLDERALALFQFALAREMKDQQRLSGDFIGSFGDALRGLWNETQDFFRNPGSPMARLFGIGAIAQLAQGMDETYIRSNPEYTKLRDIIYNAEETGTDISNDATFIAQALAKSGNVAGESMPATLAGIAATLATGGAAGAGIASWAAAAGTLAPSTVNAAVRSNIAQGNSNPWLTGAVQGGAQAAVEGIFGIIPGGGKATELMLRVGAKTPLAGRILAKAQSNALARFFFGSTAESIGETLEDPLADIASNNALDLLRSVGVDISAPNADVLANLSETLEDPAQITAMVGYCFTLGLVGVGADVVKARTFARNYDNLKAAGFSRENAAYISQRAEEISNRIAEVQANPETSESAKSTIIDSLEKDFQQEQQNLYKKDVLEQDPSVLLKRAKANKKELMSQREAALLTASGARDATLARMGIMSEPRPLSNGNYLLTFQTQKPDGTPEEMKVEWTDQQLTDWLQLQNDNLYAAAMRQYQGWLTGAALAQSPLAIQDAEQAKTRLLDLGTAPTPAFNAAFADLSKRGTIDAPFVQKLSNLANEEIKAFMDAGMSAQEARRQPSAYIPGVATGTLANLQQSARQRVASASQTTEGQTIGVTQENATFPAISIPTMDGGSVVAFISGNISPLQFSEDIWESKLKHDVAQGKYTWHQLEAQLKQAEAELKRINPAISILPKKDTLTNQDIIEGYSTLQTADFIANHRHYPLSQDTHTLLDAVVKGSQAIRASQLIGEAWKNVDKSNIDTSLADLLRDAGMQMGAVFDDAKIDARVRQAVWERRGTNESLEQQVQSVIDEYNEEQREIMDNPPEPAGTPQPIPAEESVTGEAIPAEDPLAVADNNPETGDFRIPTMPAQQGDKGRGLKDNKYAETGNGSVIGMVDPNTVKPCPEVQQFKTIDTAAGRTEAREDGTVRDLPGKWNPLADPIFLLRRKNGELQVISGRHRLAHAKKNGVKYIKAEVWDESDKFDIAWARRQDVAHNILQGTANATDIAVFFRGNPITYDEANALGFIQKKKNGEDAKASVMGITIALHASEEIYTRLVNGKVAESTAFQLASMFPDNERQQLEALDHYESGESWTSIAWYVNTSAEDFAAADGLTQGNLFGEDESAGRKKLADYVGRVEKRIRSIINLLKDAKRIKRNPALAGELGFNFSTETDIANARAQLEILLDAYQHPKQGEMEDVKRKAAAWDGKSPVNPTLSELIGEAKLLVPYSTAEAAPAEAAESMDDLFATAAIATDNPDDIAAQYANARKGSLAHRMMTHARAEANRFRRVLRKPTTDAEAAQDLASVLIFMETAMRYVPTARIPRMTAQRNALEAYIKMMQQGRIGVNRNGTIRRAGLTQEQIDAVAEQAAAAYEEAVARQDILPENKLTKEEAKKLQREFIRAAARSNIGTTIADIYDNIASAIATALSDKLIDRMHTRIGQLQPKVSANRKPLQAKVRPDAFREIGEISRIMELSQADFQKEQDALYAEMDKEDNTPERAAELDRKFALLRTYGALRSRTYGEVQTAYADLMAYIATERHLWQDILEQRDQQLQQDLKNFYDKVNPETGDAYNRQRKREELETKLGAISTYASSLKSPSQLFLALSGHSALKSLAKRTLDGISNANNAIMRAEHSREVAMLSAYARIFAIKPLGEDGQYTDRQLNDLRNGSFADFMQDILKVKDTGITRRHADDATGKEVASKIEANDAQLMNLILMAEQEHYQGNAEKWGYTQDVLDAIKAHLGARKLAFAYSLRSILQSDGLPRIFEDRTGIPMPENPNYWPGHLDLARVSQQESAALINNYSKGGTYGMLRNRVKNNYDFALADIMSVFSAACAQRNNYIYMEPVTTPWRRLLARPSFASRFEGLVGTGNYRVLTGLLDALDGAGASEGFMQRSVNGIITKFLSSYARTVLAGNPTTLLRQVDAVMHGALMENTNAAQISKQIILDRLGKGKMNYKSIMELPALKYRYKGSSAYEELIRSGANAKWSLLGNWARMNMNNIERVDIFCNAVSACALYNVTYNRLTEENSKNGGELTEQEIEKLCEQEVTNMLELTAQPLRKTQKSALVILNNSRLADACTFLGSETLNKIGYAVAMYGKVYAETGSRTKAFAAYMKPMSTMGAAGAIMTIAIEFIKTGLAGDDADKTDWLLFFGREFFVGASGLDMLADLPFAGDIFNTRSKFNKGWNLPIVTDVNEARKLWQMAIDDRDHSASEYFNQSAKLTRGLATSTGMLAGYTGIGSTPITMASGLLSSLAAAVNLVYPFTQGIERGAIWSSDWLGLESKKQRQSRERRRKALLRTLSRPITTQHRFAF